MFSFFKKATPVTEVALALWHGVLNDPGVKMIVENEKGGKLTNEQLFDEAVYFIGTATDYAIYGSLKKSPDVEKALRSAFGRHLFDYAVERNCIPCPVVTWIEGTNLWEVSSNVQSGGDPRKNFVDRCELYLIAMKRPKVASEPAVNALMALCDTRDIAFSVGVSMYWTDYLISTKKFLQSIRIKP